MYTHTHAQHYQALPVKQLKAMLDKQGADYTTCVEKEELVSRLVSTALHGSASGLFGDGFVRQPVLFHHNKRSDICSS